MARRSQTDNVRKLCACVKWKTCTHPWYVDYREGKELDASGNARRRGLRRRLSVITGREPKDFADAVAEARRAIVAWKDGRDARDLQSADDPTVAQLLEAYDKEKPRQDRWQIGRINGTTIAGITPRDSNFGRLRASTITADTLKAFKRQRPLVAGNRDLALLRAMFNWAVLCGLLPRSPFRVGDVPAVRLAREEARSRRLQGDEPERLQAGAGGLADLITAALETGCRKGELLSLQWHQVRFSPRAEIFLPAGKTKAKKDRRVPISSVLLPILQRRQLDPAGEPLSAEAYVFGDEIGRQRLSIKTAWALTLKRAKIVGLHFHDLRRECGSRWMDAGIPLATIQRWLGHANIAQTSTYLGASLGADELDMRAYEERIGRVKPLTNVDQLSGTSSDQPTSSDQTAHETTQQNVTVH
jgi:integrase